MKRERVEAWFLEVAISRKGGGAALKASKLRLNERIDAVSKLVVRGDVDEEARGEIVVVVERRSASNVLRARDFRRPIDAERDASHDASVRGGTDDTSDGQTHGTVALVREPSAQGQADDVIREEHDGSGKRLTSGASQNARADATHCVEKDVES